MDSKKIPIGQQSSKTITITEDMVIKYGEITGDYNPLHFDKEFVAKTKYGKLIAQGSLITGVINAIVAMDVPGPGSVFLHQEYDYLEPVFIGDKITGSIEVYEVHPTKPVTKINVKIINQKEELVMTGKAICYTFKM